MLTSSLLLLQFSVTAANKPRIVGVPPSDAGRGLIRVSKNEIRHYAGDRGKPFFLQSLDNGETWKKKDAPASYPPNFGGISKESPAISQNPITKEFIRVQPIRGYVFISKGGLDGKWGAVTKDGKLDFDWQKEDKTNFLTLGGIMRTPTFVNKGRRILIPAHGRTYTHISDDGGLTWSKSNSISSPSHKIGGVDKATRWQNSAVEGTIVELKDGRLWMIVRTSQDQHYETYSKDWGTTWSEAKPSRFYGTLTMPLLFRMKDGRLIMSWTNTKALPEAPGFKGGGEDAFTNRDSHHLAISHDDGKTWHGFREIILDENRNRADYATFNGPQDRGKHQSEIIQTGKNEILISLGQHKEHRRLMKVDLAFLYEKKRSNNFQNGLDDWTHHTYEPIPKGHCSYNRKPSAKLVDHPTTSNKKVMQICRLNDKSLINESREINYEKSGATWNFPNGKTGSLTLKIMANKGSQGTQISLLDRLFNACDETTEQFSMFSINFALGKKIGSQTIKPNKWYTLKFVWSDVTKEAAKCRVFINGSRQPVKVLSMENVSPNGLSYIHMISTAKTADSGVLIESVRTSVK